MEISIQAIKNLAAAVVKYSDIYFMSDGNIYRSEEAAKNRQRDHNREVPPRPTRYVRLNRANAQDWSTPEKLWSLFDSQYVEQMKSLREDDTTKKTSPNKVEAIGIDPDSAFDEIFNPKTEDKPETKEENAEEQPETQPEPEAEEKKVGRPKTK